MKRNPLRSWLPFTFAAIVAPLMAAWPQRTHAADVFWDRGSNTNAWGTGGNWSPTDTAAANTGAIPAAADTAIFNITTLTAAQTIDMGADRTLEGLRAISSGTILIQGGGTNRTLNLGAGGILKTGTGALTIGSTTANQDANLRLTADQTWANDNNTGGINILDSVAPSAAVNRLLTLAGTGTAANVVSGVISNNGAGVLSVIKTGASNWTLSGANTFTGGITIANGSLTIGNSAGAGTGAISLSSGGTAGTRLLISGGATVANPVSFGNVTGVAGQGAIQYTGTGIAALNGTLNITGNPTAGGHFVGGGAAGNRLALNGAITSTVALSQRDGFVSYSGGGTGYNDLTVTGTVMAGATNGISTVAVVRLGGSGNATLDLNGFNQSLAGLQLGNSGTAFTSTVNLGANTLALTGNITNVSAASQAVTHLFNASTGGLDVGAVNRTIDVVNGPNAEDIVLNLASIGGSGGLTKLGNGTLSLGSTATGTSALGGPLTISAGTLTVGRENLVSNITVPGIDFAAGTSLNVNVGTGGDLITAGTATAGAVTVNLSQFGGALPVGTYPILAYSGTTPGLANFTASGLPGHVAGGLVDTGSAIALQVTGNDKVVWDGTNSTAWATGATGNWKLLSNNNATDYLQSDDVIFQNGPVNSTVDVAATVLPSNVTITNTAATSYTFTGAGGIAGTTAFTKTGDGSVVVRTPTTYTGATTLSAGSVEFDYDAGNTSVLTATSGISVASGATLRLSRDGTATANAVTLSRDISGGGTIDINLRTGATGTVADGITLSGNNSGFSGTINLQAPASGTYRVQAANTAVGTAALNVASGAQFFTSANQTYLNNISISGKGYADSGGLIGALRLDGGATWAGNITVDAAGARIGAHNTTATVSGSITGGDLNVNGSDGNFNNNYTVIFTGNNSYGKTTIGGGSTATGVSSRRLNIGNGGTSGTLGSGVVEITGDAQNGVLGFDRSDGYLLGAGQTITAVGAQTVRTFIDIDTTGSGFNDNGNAINLGSALPTTGGNFRVGQARAGAIANLSGALTAGTFLVGSGQGSATANLTGGAVANVGTARVAVAGANTTSTLNLNSGSALTAFSLGLGEFAGANGILNQSQGSTVTVDAQLRVGHFGTNTSFYNMNGGSLTLTGASPTLTPSTLGAGGVSATGDNNINALATPALVGGGIYLGVDGAGVFNHNAGTVTTNWIVLDNRGATGAGVNMPDGIDRYNLSASALLNLRSTWGLIGRNDGSYAVSFAGGTVKVDNTGTGTGTGANLNIPLDAVIDTVASTTTTLDTNGAGNAFTLTKDVRGPGTLALTGGGSLNVSTAGVQTVAAALTGSNPLTKLGAGTTSLTGNVSGYTGDISVAAGRLNLPSSLGAVKVTVADGAALAGEPLSLNTLTLGSITGSTLFFDPSSAAALTTAALVVNGTNNIEVTATPVGSGPFTVLNYTTKSGTGSFAVANPTNYRSAPEVVDSGSAINVTLASGVDLTWTGAASGVWAINGATNWTNPSPAPDVFFNLDKVTFPEGGANPNVTLTGLLAPGAVTVNASTTAYTLTSTLGNQLTGTTGITKTGNGALTLVGPNLHAGPTSVGGGIVNFTDPASFGNGTLGNGLSISGGGTLRFNGSGTLDLGVNRSLAVGTGGGTLSHNNAAAATINLSGNLSGNGDLKLSSQLAGGGTFVLSGSNAGYTGNLTVEAVGTGLSTLNLANPAAVPNAASITLNYPAAGANGNATTLSLTNVATSAATTINLTSLQNGANSLRSQIVSTGDSSVNGPITAAGTSVVQWSPSDGTLTINGNTTAGTGGFNAATSVLFLRGTANGILNGSINLPGGTVTKTDAGTWTINSTGNNWANTSVSVGTVIMGAANALPAGVNLNLGQNDGNAATLNLNGFSQTIGSLSSNPATVGANSTGKSITSATPATLTVDQATATTYASLLNGSLTLEKQGSGNLTLAATTSNFTGNVVVSGGTLTAAAAAAANGSAGPLGVANLAGKTVTVAPGATLAFTSNNVFGNGIGNASLPALTVNGGILNSTRYNVVGDVALNGGTLSQTSTDNGGYQGFALRGDVTAGGTAPSFISTTNGKGTHLGANTTFTVGNATGDAAPDLIINTPLLNQSADFGSAAGGLTKAGPGTLSLAAGVVSAYTGPTVVSGGILDVNGNIASSSSLTVAGGSILTGSGTTPSLAFADTSILSPGNSPGTLTTTGSATFTSGTILRFELNGGDTTIGSGINDLFTGVTTLTLDGLLDISETVPASFFSLAGLGDTWRLIDYTGALTNNGLLLGAQPALASGLSFNVDTNTAGQVNLVVVPETSSAGLLGLTALLSLRRRRRAA